MFCVFSFFIKYCASGLQGSLISQWWMNWAGSKASMQEIRSRAGAKVLR
jgi:hypothetical protein